MAVLAVAVAAAEEGRPLPSQHGGGGGASGALLLLMHAASVFWASDGSYSWREGGGWGERVWRCGWALRWQENAARTRRRRKHQLLLISPHSSLIRDQTRKYHALTLLDLKMAMVADGGKAGQRKAGQRSPPAQRLTEAKCVLED